MPKEWTGLLIGRMHNERVTYEELAEELGVTKPYIGMILNGKRNPPGIQEKMEAAFERIVQRKKLQE